MQWQPIETAPRDGTEIFVALRGGARFVAAFGMGDGKKLAWRHHTPFGAAIPGDPTHWMPLPEPPQHDQ